MQWILALIFLVFLFLPMVLWVVFAFIKVAFVATLAVFGFVLGLIAIA